MSSSRLPELTDTAPRPGLRRWAPRSLSTRLVLSTLLLVALVSVAVGAVTTIALRQFLISRLDDQLVSASLRHDGGGDGPLGGPGGLAQAPCAVVPPGGTAGFFFGQAPGTLIGRFDPTCRSAVVVTEAGTLSGVTRSDAAL